MQKSVRQIFEIALLHRETTEIRMKSIFLEICLTESANIPRIDRIGTVQSYVLSLARQKSLDLFLIAMQFPNLKRARSILRT